MDILILTNKLPYPPKDGGSIATLNLASGLANRQANIDLLAINTSKHFFSLDKIPAKIKDEIRFYDVFVNTDLSPFKLVLNLLFSSKPYNAIRFYDKNYEGKLANLLKTKSYDIIQLEGLYMCQYMDTIRKFSDAKIVMRSHNIEHEIWERNAQLETNIIKRIYLKILAQRIKKLEIKTVNNFDALLPITQRDADSFISFQCQIPTKVIQVGINIEEYKEISKKLEFPSLFHIGAMDWMPNIEGLKWFFENVWKEIYSKNPNLKFYLAGRNASEKFENYIQKIKGVEYLGEVENAREFIRSKAIMIVPLFAGSGMRIKIVEGLAMGKVIISTNIGVEGIPVNDDENMLLANNKLTFINKIENIINDRSTYDLISKNAVQMVRENFDTFAISNELIDFYKSL